MHSYKTLAVLALAVSTASPAFSAPVRESRQQARTNVDERASALPSGVGKDVVGLLKTIGTSLALGALPVALEHFLGGNDNNNDTRRALPSDAPPTTSHIVFDDLPVDIHGPPTSIDSVFGGPPLPADHAKRASRVESSFGKLFGKILGGPTTSSTIGGVITDGVLGGIATGVGAIGANELLDNTRREPSPPAASDFSGIAKTIVDALASLASADGWCKGTLQPRRCFVSGPL